MISISFNSIEGIRALQLLAVFLEPSIFYLAMPTSRFYASARNACTSDKAQKLVNKYLACVGLYCEVDIKGIFVSALWKKKLGEVEC